MQWGYQDVTPASWGASVLKSKNSFYVLQIYTILISIQDYRQPCVSLKKQSVFLKIVQGFGMHLSNLCLWGEKSILKQRKKIH